MICQKTLCSVATIHSKTYLRQLKHLRGKQVPVAGYQSISNSGDARICCQEGQSWKLGMEHWEPTADFRAGCSSCSMTNSVVRNAVLIETTAVSCCHLHPLLSQTTQYLDGWQSVLLQSELKIKLLEVEGRSTCPSAQ